MFLDFQTLYYKITKFLYKKGRGSGGNKKASGVDCSKCRHMQYRDGVFEMREATHARLQGGFWQSILNI